MLNGCLVAESLRAGGQLSGVPLRVTKIWRGEPGSATAGQPALWTLMEFEAPAADAERLACALADCLAPAGGWYTDFHTELETFVVFAGRVFRYPRGDAAGRELAQRYGRDHGVPEAQLDWRV